MFSINSNGMFIRDTFSTLGINHLPVYQVNGACCTLLITCCPGTGSSSVPKMDLTAACEKEVYETSAVRKIMFCTVWRNLGQGTA